MATADTWGYDTSRSSPPAWSRKASAAGGAALMACRSALVSGPAGRHWQWTRWIYVARYHPKTPFYPDPAFAPQPPDDAQGWRARKPGGGWAVRGQGRYVRMISLGRSGRLSRSAWCPICSSPASVSPADLVVVLSIRTRCGMQSRSTDSEVVSAPAPAQMGPRPRGRCFSPFCHSSIQHCYRSCGASLKSSAQARPIPTLAWSWSSRRPPTH